MVKGAIRLLGGTLLFGQPRSIIAFVYFGKLFHSLLK